MSVCPQCDKGKFMKVFHTKVRAKRGQLPRNESFFELDCGHVRDLDEYNYGDLGRDCYAKEMP